MKKTKIIATIGPSSIDYDIMKKMVLAGLDVVRINLSHAKLESMNTVLSNVKKLRKELKVPLPIMLDTRGPELRVKTFKDGGVEIKKGQQFIFTTTTVVGNNERVTLNMPSIIKNVKAGDKILACDGLLAFDVIDVTETDILTKAKNEGKISNNKSLCVPGIQFTSPYLNALDKKDILWGIKNNVELIAASFVNSKADVTVLKNFITKNGGDMKIISKIESQNGVKNLEEIIKASDGIMVARGDLGVETPIEILPELQKLIIKKSVRFGKTVITATEMLESMITNNRPTRAEVSDIANAMYDGTSCVMLSGETASGNYPVEAVKTMAKVCMETEKYIGYNETYYSMSADTTADLIAQGAVGACSNHNIKYIMAFTTAGQTVRLISKYRPKAEIIGATPNEKVFRQMALIWGVKPMLISNFETTDQMFKISNDLLKKNKLAKVGDKIVVTSGAPNQNGGTNLLKIITIN